MADRAASILVLDASTPIAYFFFLGSAIDRYTKRFGCANADTGSSRASQASYYNHLCLSLSTFILCHLNIYVNKSSIKKQLHGKLGPSISSNIIKYIY